MFPKTLVFSGGGTRCLVLSEVLFLLEKEGCLRDVLKFWGTSAGALLAALYALTRSAAQVKTILWDLDFSSFRNVDVYVMMNIMNTWAIDDGVALQTKIEELLEKALAGGSSLRLRDLPELNICVADLSVRETLILNAGTYPDLRIAEAVRASMTLPIFLAPYRAPNGHIWVDGGVRANFPWFQVPEAERSEALGLCFTRTDFEEPRNFSEFILSMIHFDGAKKSNIPYTSNNVLCVPTPPFPAWFLRLREADYVLVCELARIGYDGWRERVAAAEGKAPSASVPRHAADSEHPQGTSGSPRPSALLCTPQSSFPAHHTAEPSDIPRVSQLPSQDSSRHSPPHKPQISRRWSL
jgi:hypothetical protein